MQNCYHQNNILNNIFDRTTTNENRDEGHLNECVDIRENWLSELFDNLSDNEIINEDVYYKLPIEKNNISDFRQFNIKLAYLLRYTITITRVINYSPQCGHNIFLHRFI